MTASKGYLPCKLQLPAGCVGNSRYDPQIVTVKLSVGDQPQLLWAYRFDLTFDHRSFISTPSWVWAKVRPRRRTGSGCLAVTIVERRSNDFLVVKLPTLDRPTDNKTVVSHQIKACIRSADILWNEAQRDTYLAEVYAKVRLNLLLNTK